jgi:hypothetical protein
VPPACAARAGRTVLEGKLVSLGLVIADTYPDKRIARFAVERTLREIAVDECLLLSDTCFVPGARHVAIDPITSLAQYNALALDGLPGWTGCDTTLLIQWDGFVLDGRRWRKDFAEWDYIGAPWLHLGSAVGNGGFSLRSRRLLNAVQRLRREEPEADVETAEDLQICFKYRAALQAQGLRFPDAELAGAFARERLPGVPGGAVAAAQELDSFGFHGVFNFPLVLAEAEVLEQFDSILPRMGSASAVWFLFVWHAWCRRYRDLGTRALQALGQRDAALWGEVVQACLLRGMSPQWIVAAG